MTFIEITPDVVATRDTVAGASFKGLPIVAVRKDADGLIEADGDFAALQMNGDGRLKVAATPAVYPVITQTINGNSQNVIVDTSRASNATVHIKGGAVAGAGGNFTFQGSLDSTDGNDGTWFNIQAVRTDSNTVATTTGVLALAINTGVTYAWELSVNAYQWMRVRSTAFTSGQYVVTIVRGTYATEPIPAIQNHGISGTVGTSMAASATGSPAKAEDAVHASGDVGVFALAVRNDNVATAPTSANGDYSSIAADANGALFVRERPSLTPTVSRVTSVATTTTLLAANAARRLATIFNESTSTLFVKFGATASVTSYTVQVPAGGYYEVPGFYSGIIDGIWAAANGAAQITEVV